MPISEQGMMLRGLGWGLWTGPGSGLPWWLRWSRIRLSCRRPRFDPWVGKIPWRRKWQPTAVFLSGEFHGRRSLAGYIPWVRKESDMIEPLTLWMDFFFWITFLKYIYVAASGLSCGRQAGSFIASQASLVVALGLSNCPTACGILAP